LLFEQLEQSGKTDNAPNIFILPGLLTWCHSC